MDTPESYTKIDQKTGEIKDTVCPRSRMVRQRMVALNHEQKKLVVFSPRCKQWSCPVCGEINSRAWYIRARAGVWQLQIDGVPMHFLTLTSHEKLSPGQSLYVWPKAWKKLRTRITRAIPTGYDFYIAVPERQGNGKIHLHVIESWGLGTRWFKDNARQCGMGFEEEEKPVLNAGLAGHYVCKYLMKTIENPEQWPPYFHRLRVSQSWPDLEPRFNEYEFVVAGRGQRSPTYLAEFYQFRGYEVEYLEHNEAWSFLDGQLDNEGK